MITMAGITAIGYLVFRYTAPIEVRCFTLQASSILHAYLWLSRPRTNPQLV
jgi:hypothetical protein